MTSSLFIVVLAITALNHNYQKMTRHSVPRILQPIKKVFRLATALVLFAAVSLSLTNCVPTPEDERLVSAEHQLSISVSPGTCEQLANGEQHLQSSWNETGLTPQHISVLNWNIYKENRTGWREDLRKFGREKDLILLQEAHLDDEFQTNLAQKGLYWNFNSAFNYKGAATGVMIASRVSPIESCALQEIEPLLGLPKTALVSLYPVAGSAKQLMVANIHGVNFTLGTATYKKQFEAIKQLLDNHRGPIILAGDFNNWSDKRSAVIAELANDLGLSALSFEDDGRTTVFSNPIDHILYRGLDVVSNDVHQVESSDHNPITAVFRLQQQFVAQSTGQ